MANDATLTPSMLAVKRYRAELVRRWAEHVTELFGAAGATVILTLPEQGAKELTFSTAGFTTWGSALYRLTEESRIAVVKMHAHQAEKIVADSIVQIEAQISAPEKEPPAGS